jgi:hypothetical protein
MVRTDMRLISKRYPKVHSPPRRASQEIMANDEATEKSMTVHSMRQRIHVFAVHSLALLRVVFIVIFVLVCFEFVQLVLVYNLK